MRLCPLWSNNGHSRVPSDCPLSASSGHQMPTSFGAPGSTVRYATQTARKAALKTDGITTMNRLNFVATAMKTTSANKIKQEAAKINTLVTFASQYFFIWGYSVRQKLSMDSLRQSTSWWSWYRPLRCLRLRRSMQPPQRPGNRYEPSGVLAFAIGFGGSMTWFGSSAGAALANIYPEARSVGLWLRHGWHVALAHVIGFFIMLAILGWNPDVSPTPIAIG